MAIFNYKPTPTGDDTNLGYMADRKLRATTSTQIVLKVRKRNEKGTKAEMMAVGAIQSIGPNTTRSISPIREMGSDHIVELVPGIADFKMSINRIQIDRQKISEAFGIDYRDIHSQIFPFDIELLETYVSPDPKIKPAVVRYVTTYLDCFFTDVSFSIDVTNNLMITDTANCTVTRVTTTKYTADTIGGTLRKVEPGDTIEAIADAYGIGPRDVINSF